MNDTAPTRIAARLAALFLLVSAGCGGGGKDNVFDEISRMPTREDLVEVDLGSFKVPVPIVLESAIEAFEPDNLIQVELDLVAVVVPDDEGLVERLKERNGGRIRDQVIRVCRSTTRDDLLEPQKTTLKAHLLDAVRPLVGADIVRRLVVKRVNLEEL